MSFFAHHPNGVVPNDGWFSHPQPDQLLRGLDSPLRLGMGPWRVLPQLITGQGFLTGMPFATGGPATYHNWTPAPPTITTGPGFLTGQPRTQPQTP